MAQVNLEPWQIDPRSEWLVAFNHSGYDGIKCIEVTHNGALVHMGVLYMKGNREEQKDIGYPYREKSDEYQRDKVTLEYPSEYLVSIEGTIVGGTTDTGMSRLKLITNKNPYGPFGTLGEGTPFVFRMDGAKIVGFHGTYNHMIPRIYLSGINVKSCGAPPSAFHAYNPGPFGGGGGEPWDDGIFARINQVVIYFDDNDGTMISLETFYELDGSSSSTLHPTGKTTRKFLAVEFKKEHNEYLTRISGFFGPLEGHPDVVAVKALWFHTSEYSKGYGPYGNETGSGEFFSSSSEEGEIVGFHGRSGEARLYAIGTHTKYANPT